MRTNLADQTGAVDAALAWLLTQQEADGSFGASADGTLNAVLAASAAGADVATWRGAGNVSSLDYLASQVDAYATGAATTGKLVVGLVAAGEDPWAFAGHDLEDRLLAYADGAGSFGTLLADQAWALLALDALRRPATTPMVQNLVSRQNQDGGWGWQAGEGSDTRATALALQALAAQGVSATEVTVTNALAFLKTTQGTSGGLGEEPGMATDVISTAAGLQALIALDQNPLDAAWQMGGNTPLDALLAAELEGGAFPGADQLAATSRAVPALLGKGLPLPGLVPALKDALAYLRSIQQPDGSITLANSSVALWALTAAGEHARTWRVADGPSLIDYLNDSAGSLTSIGQVGRLAAALAMAGENPYRAGTENLIARIWEAYDPATGAFDAAGMTSNQCLAIWGLVSVGEVVPPEALTWLRAQQHEDGGWAWGVGLPGSEPRSDANSTAMVIETLIASGVASDDPAIQDAVAYLASLQANDGGFVYDPVYGSDSDADSTALTLQALWAVGIEPSWGWGWARTLTATEQISMTVNKPFDRLLDLQLGNGAFEWQPGFGENPYSTMEAIPALARVTFPWTDPTKLAARRALAWLKAQQQDDGSFSEPADAALVLDVALAAAAMGEDLNTWRTAPGMPSVLDWLEANLGSYATSADATGKVLVALVAAGQNPLWFAGENWVKRLLALEEEGAFGVTPAGQAWALLGLASAGQPVTPAQVDALEQMQGPDGGWGAVPQGASAADITALCLQALVAADVSIEVANVQAGLAYLASLQAAGGGFAPVMGEDVSAVATGTAIQGLAAAGEAPNSDAWQQDGHSPVDALTALQSESGAFRGAVGEDEVEATARAIPGLLIESMPYSVGHYDLIYLPLVRN
ncbi:MAG: terpene cyclase/mutase family protein [Anaerolineae bacterium]|nr:terpene cyclase/mutase family protein [Anaerolineae bacterium]